MKPLFLAVALAAGSAVAQAQTPATATLARRLNQLMQEPGKSDTEIRAVLTDCHITQVIRKYRTGAGTAAEGGAFQVSHQKNGTDWAVKTDDKVELELKIGVEWSQVTALSYAPAHDEDTNRHYYQVKIRRERPAKGGGTNATSLELPLYTADEAVARDVVRQLEQLRRQCTSQGG